MKNILFLSFLLIGCAPQNQATHDEVNQLREELRAIRASIEALNKDLGDARVQIEVLKGQQIQPNASVRQSVDQSQISPQDQSSNDASKSRAKLSTPSTNDKPVGTNTKGATIYQGPRGGLYHYSPSGKKVYERKKR
jgi:hypothetical protein